MRDTKLLSCKRKHNIFSGSGKFYFYRWAAFMEFFRRTGATGSHRGAGSGQELMLPPSSWRSISREGASNLAQCECVYLLVSPDIKPQPSPPFKKPCCSTPNAHAGSEVKREGQRGSTLGYCDGASIPAVFHMQRRSCLYHHRKGLLSLQAVAYERSTG